MSEPHPDVQAAVDAAAGLGAAGIEERATRLEAVAARLESALSDNAG